MPLNPIPVIANLRYGGNLITEKYSPLSVNDAQVKIDNDTEDAYLSLLTGRRDRLRNQNLFPRTLNLCASNWETIQANEFHEKSLPPIVVVSHNRAEWIKMTFDRVKDIPEDRFTDVNDKRKLLEIGAIPWYHPKRIRNNMVHVYIVVHAWEYDYYTEKLQGTGITVIGWSFQATMSPRDTSSDPESGSSYLGFGASRFAAIEFCKYIFNKPMTATNNFEPLHATRQKAWLVDDNVVYVNGFPGFKQVADAMTKKGVWGLGFSGTTSNETDKQLRERFAPKESKEEKETVPADPNNLASEGILQQCVLWDIAQLNKANLNFSPYFFSSNEDTSLSNFLAAQEESRVGICTSGSVVKAEPAADINSKGAKIMARLRIQTLDSFYAIEKDYKVNPGFQKEAKLLSRFIKEDVVDKVDFMGQSKEDPVITECKAVEQLMAKLVSYNYANLVPGYIFRPNGKEKQNVERFTSADI